MTGTADSFVAALVASGWPWRRLQSGSLYIDVAAPDPPPAVGETMNLVLIAFLQEPKPSVYRVSNEPSCQVTAN